MWLGYITTISAAFPTAPYDYKDLLAAPCTARLPPASEADPSRRRLALDVRAQGDVLPVAEAQIERAGGAHRGWTCLSGECGCVYYACRLNFNLVRQQR